jgi:hypothetical protein
MKCSYAGGLAKALGGEGARGVATRKLCIYSAGKARSRVVFGAAQIHVGWTPSSEMTVYGVINRSL